MQETNTKSTNKTLLSLEFAQAIEKVIPGGVNSPFRSFEEVGGHTISFTKAFGAYLFDLDGNKYVDYLGAWGPAILGHCPQEVIRACQKTLEDGPVFGAPHKLELELAKLIISFYPSIEMLRFVNSGTEATMSAIRLARGITGRDLIIMFAGCYHGHNDAVLASNTSKSSSGIPKTVAENTILVPFNDHIALKNVLEANHGKIAAVIIEPIAGSMGVIPPISGYLENVRKLCDAFDCLLIFDEVLTGLRVALGGAQALYNIKPDITCFGKTLGGGMPIGAYGGNANIMKRLMPIGDVYQAGTFSGNPVTMAGGIATLKLLSNPVVYEKLESRSAQLFTGIQETIKELNAPVQLQRVGSMFSILFSPKPVQNHQDALKIDTKSYAKFFHYLLDHGIYIPPTCVDAACLSAAHSESDIEKTVVIFAQALKTIY